MEEILEWYRVDQTARIRRVLGAGAGILTFGALVTSVSFLADQRAFVRGAASVVGILCCIAGALTAVIGMYRALRDDAYLTVRADGILYHAATPPETFIAWADLVSVRFDEARGAVVFERREATEILAERPFAGTTLADLAKRLDDLRRKAAWNLL